MKRFVTLVFTVSMFAAQLCSAQTAATDIYHVMFVKAAPGMAKTAEQQVIKQDAKAPMKGHYLVLRHQEGADWDFMVIEHLGKKFTIDPTEYAPPPANGPAVGAWHEDTFVVGPAWEQVNKELMSGSVYIVGIFRAVPGKRADLEKMLADTGKPKVSVGSVTFAHMEGGPWNFLNISRYNSWQDLATDEGSGGNSDRWYRTREAGSWHQDTIADRVALAK